MSPTRNANQPSPDHRKTKTAQTAFYFVAFIALGLTTNSLGPTLMALSAHTKTGLEAISLVFVARSFGYLFGSLWCGKLFDFLPGHKVLQVSLLLMAAMLALTPLATVLWLLLAVSVILGATEGALDVGGNTLLLWARSDNAGHYLNALHFFFGVGSLLAPLLVAFSLTQSQDIWLSYWLIAALVLLLSLALPRLPSPLPVNHETAAKPPGEMRLVVLLALVFFFYTGVEVSFGGWIYTYAIAVEAATITSAAYLTSLFWAALTLGRLLAIPFSQRFRPRAILITDLAGSLLCLLLILLSRSTSALWAGTCGLGLFMASVFPTLFVFAEQRMAISGRIASWFIIGASLGCKITPYLIGHYFVRQGPQSLLWISLASLLLALSTLLMALRLPVTQRGEAFSS